MNKFIVLCIIVLFGINDTYASAGIFKKKKKTSTTTGISTNALAPKKSKYENLFDKKDCVSSKSDFITIHKVGKKIYFEFPLKYLEREMLLGTTLAATSDNTVGTIGYKEKSPLHIKFVKVDSTIHIQGVNCWAFCDEEDESLNKAMEINFQNPIFFSYDILTYSPDSSAVVIDVTPLFLTHIKSLNPIPEMINGTTKLTPSFVAGSSYLEDIKSFEDNLSVRSVLTYNLTGAMSGQPLFSDVPVTLTVNRSILLLPEKKMHPRVSDSRLGVFLTDKHYISTEEDRIQLLSFARRWRVEPKDIEAYKRGELVEPEKPILFYLDNSFPQMWKEPIKEGALRWNKAFEKIGFKNVIQVLDFPENTPEFDPDNLKYSCIRYQPSTIANAMGPSWTDPATGEIVNASVIIYNDIVKLISNWRVTQTSQIDPTVRSKKMPDHIIKESIAYVVAHEIGHCLGLMHNMAGSAAFPVDSLRSASFTQKYGTTSSIMDYARFNYVAQPGDKGVKLTPPDLGVYDEFIIQWLYQPLYDINMKEECRVLESWVDEKAGNPFYRYGKQQVQVRMDPSAIEEDLGDDPIKAGDYGIKNLKFILSNINSWITDDDDFLYRKEFHSSLTMQYYRYLKNVMMNIGGIYLTEVKDGTKGNRHISVPKSKQKASLKWTINQLRSCDWLDKNSLSNQLDLSLSKSALIRSALIDEVISSGKKVVLSAHVSQDPYSLKEFYDDLYNSIWLSTINDKKLTEGDKMLQKSFVKFITSNTGGGGAGGLTVRIGRITDGYAPSVNEMVAYGIINDYCDIYKLKEWELLYGSEYVIDNLQLNNFGHGYGWQKPVSSDVIDNSDIYMYELCFRTKTLLEQKIKVADSSTLAHYKLLLFNIEKAISLN